MSLWQRFRTAALVVCLVALAALSLQAQGTPDLSSPRATMFTFLDAVNAVRAGDESQLQTAMRALDLRRLGVAPSSDAARRAARQLWSSLNRIRRVEPEELPSAEELDPTDSVFVYFPRDFAEEDEGILERVDVGAHQIAFARQPNGQWLFSGQTLVGIAELNAALMTLPQRVGVDEQALETPAWVRDFVPRQLRQGAFLGLRSWQWLALLVLAFLGVVADYVARLLTVPLARRAARRAKVEVPGEPINQAGRAVGLLAMAGLWLALFPAIGLVDRPEEIGRAAVGFFTVLAATFAGWKLADLIGEIFVARSELTASKFDDVLVPLVRKTAKIFILAFGIVYGAQNLNINIVPLLTGLGIGGLAFAFAAKDTIENLFGSVAVVLDRPFEVGDMVKIGDIDGTVEQLGFRSTRIRTLYDSVVTMPNAALVRATVDNYGRRKFRRWRTTLGVQYDTPPEKLIAFTEGVRELIRARPSTRKEKYEVRCNEFSDSSLNILLQVFFEVPDWSAEIREREALFLDIVRLADRLGVQFAFPTRTIHLYKEEHETPQSRYGVPRETTDKQAGRAGAHAAQEIIQHQPWRREPPPKQE